MVMPRSAPNRWSPKHTSDSFVVAEDSGLRQQGVDQGRFAMINVGDDRDIANRLLLGAHTGYSSGIVKNATTALRKVIST